MSRDLTKKVSNTPSVPNYIKREWRCEQLVDGEWIEIPHGDLTLISWIRDQPRLMRGDREVGGPWRMFIDGELAYTWSPW